MNGIAWSPRGSGKRRRSSKIQLFLLHSQYKYCFMKRIMNFSKNIAALLLMLLTGGYTFAQGADTMMSEDAYRNSSHKFTTVLDGGTIPYIALVVVFLLILFVGYRYWHDNRNVEKTPHKAH